MYGQLIKRTSSLSCVWKLSSLRVSFLEVSAVYALQDYRYYRHTDMIIEWLVNVVTQFREILQWLSQSQICEHCTLLLNNIDHKNNVYSDSGTSK